MIFLILIALLFETSAGLNLRQLQQRPDKNLAAKLIILNKEQSRESIKQQINPRIESSNQIVAEFKFRTVPSRSIFLSMSRIALSDGILALGNSLEKSASNWGRKACFLLFDLLL